MRIVRFDCGCIGTEPDAEGKSLVLAACDSNDGGPGSPDGRYMAGKTYADVYPEYAQELHEHAVASSKLRQIKSAFALLNT